MWYNYVKLKNKKLNTPARWSLRRTSLSRDQTASTQNSSEILKFILSTTFSDSDHLYINDTSNVRKIGIIFQLRYWRIVQWNTISYRPIFFQAAKQF